MGALCTTSTVTPVIGLILAVPDIVMDRSHYRQGGVLWPDLGGPGRVGFLGSVIISCGTEGRAVRCCDIGRGSGSASGATYIASEAAGRGACSIRLNPVKN